VLGSTSLRRAVAARQSSRVRIGVISDSHGYLDPEVLGVFSGVAHIVHAGDIGDRGVLAALEAVAPVTAVAGNIEPEELLASLPREAAGEVEGVRFVVAHKRKRLFKRLAAGKVPAGLDDAPDLVIYGHDHLPASSWVDGTLFLNPGTASAPDDEDDDPTVAVVEDTGSGLAATFFPLRRREA
jgi:putative phosphoesterase